MRLTTTLWRLCVLTLASARPHPLSLPVTISTAVQDDLDLPINTTATSSSLVGPLPVLLTRARNGQEPLPLLTPVDESITGRGRAGRQIKFMEKLLTEVPDESPGDIPIVPNDEQLQSWKINGIPIGVTSYWYPWPSERKMTWKMRGLAGCTATIIVSEEGFWAAHHWETVKATTPGGSSFNTRIPPSNEIVETPLDLFQTIAVDILDGPVPPGVSRYFLSFTDLESRFGDPFAHLDNDMHIFVLTKSNGVRDKKPRYDGHVNLLKKGYTDRLPGAHYKQDTYVGDEKLTQVKKTIAGTILVQWTPCERDDPRDDCGKMGKVVVWAEDKTKPMIEQEDERE